MTRSASQPSARASGRALLGALALLVAAGCTSTPAPGRYEGTLVYFELGKDATGMPVGDKKRTSGSGAVTITQAGPHAIDAAIEFLLQPSISCTVHATEQEAGLVIAPTECVAREDSHVKGGGPSTEPTKVTVSGRIDRGSSDDISMALMVEGPKYSIAETLDATRAK